MKSLLILLILVCSTNALGSETTITSPNGKTIVNFQLTASGEPVYDISHSGSTVLKQSRLGVIRNDGDFSTKLTLDSISGETIVTDAYTLLHGKRRQCTYTGTRRVVYLKNEHSREVEIIFQVSDNGIAFRYFFPERSDSTVGIIREATSYHFAPDARAFLQPCPDARMSWCFSSPSYEEYYSKNIPVGTPSPYQAGWVMPALFHTGNDWVSITETAVDTNYCGTRLSQYSPDGEYFVQFPEPQECRANEPVNPVSTLPWYTPWRVVAISDNLAGLVESTLETDLSIPAKYDVSSWLQPGIASWSWVILKDDSTVYGVQRRYIDFAAAMHWQYCLIDAGWDTQIGYENIKRLAEYAKSQGVKLLLWYNSAGDWNTTPQTPRDKLLTPISRNAEFQKLKDMGIAGIKVDFFGGDGQSMMRYYINILQDAARYELAVNFHGSTFPRSWYRTYPNLVSMEAIRGEEYVTFGQFFADQQPSHCAMIPFTRNLFDPMDFTPVNFSGIPHEQRRTSGGFELALSVMFTSGIQHIAETPEGMAAQENFVRNYMSSLPAVWDDVKFIDGFPGKYVVLARRSGHQWYIAGINGEASTRSVTLDLSFVTGQLHATIITDADSGKGMTQKDVDVSTAVSLTMKAFGGFVIKTQAPDSMHDPR